MLKTIIKRVIIAICVITILKWFSSLTGTGFIVPFNVYALEKPNFLIGINKNTNSTEPVLKNGLNSNVFKDDFDNSPNLQFGYSQVNVSISELDSNNGVNVPYWDSFDTATNDLTRELRFPNYSGYNSYVYRYNFKPNGNLVLKYDNHYTLLLLITRGDNSNYQTGFPDISLDSLQFSVGNNNTLIEGKSFLSNVKLNYYKIQEKVDTYSEYSYILLDFDIDSDDFPSYNGNIYLQSIELSSQIFYDNSSVKLPLSYFLESHRVDNKDNGYFNVDFYFLENAYVGYFGVSCDSNGCKSNAGYNDMYDYVTSKDIDILNTMETCPDEISLSSITCHIKRVFDMIYRFFVRISNMFTDLLSPNENFTIAQQYFDTFHLEDGGLASVITAPLSVIENLDANSCEPVSVTLPQVNQQITFPCLKSSVYQANFPSLLLFIQAISTGSICYFCLTSIFRKVRSLQNPDTNDKIEVISL